MQPTQLTALTGIILGLQFAAFGWRVNREMKVNDEARKTWFPLPDCLNIVALFLVVIFCILVPLSKGDYSTWSRRILAVAGALIAFHPLTMAAHYGLPYRRERPTKKNGDFQYAPTEEIVTFAISILFAIGAGWWVAR